MYRCGGGPQSNRLQWSLVVLNMKWPRLSPIALKMLQNTACSGNYIVSLLMEQSVGDQSHSLICVYVAGFRNNLGTIIGLMYSII